MRAHLRVVQAQLCRESRKAVDLMCTVREIFVLHLLLCGLPVYQGVSTAL